MPSARWAQALMPTATEKFPIAGQTRHRLQTREARVRKRDVGVVRRGLLLMTRHSRGCSSVGTDRTNNVGRHASPSASANSPVAAVRNALDLPRAFEVIEQLTNARHDRRPA